MASIPTLNASAVPHLSVAQMIEVDRAMVEEIGIDLPRMMENAGRALATLARTRFLGGNCDGKKVLVLAGPGGNGGGALASARHLYNWGAEVQVVLSRPPSSLTPVTGQQLRILDRMGVPTATSSSTVDHSAPSVIIDGLLGYSLNGPPRGAAAALIRWAENAEAPILALDVPSGVDADTGAVCVPAIRAAATLTLALPKRGLGTASATAHVGELFLADIGVPASLYARPPLCLQVSPLFAQREIVRLTTAKPNSGLLVDH